MKTSYRQKTVPSSVLSSLLILVALTSSALAQVGGGQMACCNFGPTGPVQEHQPMLCDWVPIEVCTLPAHDPETGEAAGLKPLLCPDEECMTPCCLDEGGCASMTQAECAQVGTPVESCDECGICCAETDSSSAGSECHRGVSEETCTGFKQDDGMEGDFIADASLSCAPVGACTGGDCTDFDNPCAARDSLGTPSFARDEAGLQMSCEDLSGAIHIQVESEIDAGSNTICEGLDAKIKLSLGFRKITDVEWSLSSREFLIKLGAIPDSTDSDGPFDKDGFIHITEVQEVDESSKTLGGVIFTDCQRLPFYLDLNIRDDCSAGVSDPCKDDPDDTECQERVGRADDLPNFGDPVEYHNGSFYMENKVDLQIPGRGMDFVWARNYRSQLRGDSPLGYGWDHSYNKSITQDNGDIVVNNGRGRTDRFQRFPNDNSRFGLPKFFKSIKEISALKYDIELPDGTIETYITLGSGPAEGKLESITDSNGNHMEFFYDNQGRLQRINDTLGRDITVAYNSEGRISSVTDFAGRQIRYDYYQPGESKGGPGDLKSVTGPPIEGTPTENNFPDGKTVTYTYSKGFADERLNHNLLTVIDAKGQTFLRNVYSAVTDPADFTFDKVVTQYWGDPQDRLDFTYVEVDPSNQNNYSTKKVIMRDREGRVIEQFYRKHLMTLRREFTGFSDTTRPVTDDLNRPGELPGKEKRRDSDPDYFETRYHWNEEYEVLMSVVQDTGGIRKSMSFLYDFNLNPNFTEKSAGNIRRKLRSAGFGYPSDQQMIEERFEYHPDYPSLVTRYINPLGNEKVNEYDSRGNLTRVIHPDTNIVERYQYNQYGQLAAKIHAEDANGHRRRDEFKYFTSGPQAGFLEKQIIDATGLRITTQYETDQFGNVTRIIDPNGNDSISEYNAVNQKVRELSPEVDLNGTLVRYETLYYYDANNNLVRTDISNLDDRGNVIDGNPYLTSITEYEILNKPTKTCAEVGVFNGAIPGPVELPNCLGLPQSEFVATETVYDRNRNATFKRFGVALDSSQPGNIVQTLYDERGQVFRVIRAPGTREQHTTQYDYDGTENPIKVTSGLESPNPRVVTRSFDGHGRLMIETDPMGNRIEYHYDANGNVTGGYGASSWGKLVYGERVDIEGSTGNQILYMENVEFDQMNRPVSKTVAHLDENGAPVGDGESVTTTEYAPNSAVISVTDDNNHSSLTEYDTIGRPFRVTDALGNTVTTTYDANGNTLSTLALEVLPDGSTEAFESSFDFDALNRVTSSMDPGEGVTTLHYDSRGNTVKTVDALGNVVKVKYDGLGRVVETKRILRQDGTGDTRKVGTIITRQTFDDNSRLLSQTDDNGNGTRYAYDNLDRLIVTQHPDGTLDQVGHGAAWSAHSSRPDLTGFTPGYDANGNAIIQTDSNGTSFTNVYDLNNRVVRSTIPLFGSGVSEAVTEKSFEYDGTGRMVSALTRGEFPSVVIREYDSLSNLVLENQNGAAVRSTYDGLGNRTSLTYPSGRTLTFNIDDLNRLSSINENGVELAYYSYAGASRVYERGYLNGIRTEFSHDVKGRVTEMSTFRGSTLIDGFTYDWDPIGNKTAQNRVGGLQQSFTYDSQYRLVVSDALLPGATNPLRSRYNLDGVGNWLSVTGGMNPGEYTVGGQPGAQTNQYTSVPGEDRSYDSNGNLIARQDHNLSFGIQQGEPTVFPTAATLTYDATNKMTEYFDAARNYRHEYGYDAFGRRIVTSVATPSGREVTNFIYDGDRVIEEQDDSGNVLASYVYGNYIDEVLSMQRDVNGDGLEEDYWYTSNDKFDVTAIYNDFGQLVEKYAYSDYGVIFDAADYSELITSQVGNPYFFTGRRFDFETELYYFRARYLDPVNGRFTQRDPIGAWGDSSNNGNGQAYAGNNPHSKVDPSGNDDEYLSEDPYRWCACGDCWSCSIYDSEIGGLYQGIRQGKAAYDEAMNTVAIALGAGSNLEQIYALMKIGSFLEDQVDSVKATAGAMRDFVQETHKRPSYAFEQGFKAIWFLNTIDGRTVAVMLGQGLVESAPGILLGGLSEGALFRPGAIGRGFKLPGLPSKSSILSYLIEDSSIIRKMPGSIQRPLMNLAFDTEWGTRVVLKTYDLKVDTLLYRVTAPEYVTDGLALANSQSIALVQVVRKGKPSKLVNASSLGPSLNVAVKNPGIYGKADSVLIEMRLTDVLSQRGQLFWDHGAVAQGIDPLIVTLPKGSIPAKVVPK